MRVSFGLTPISTEWSGPATCSARKEALQRGDQPGAKAVIMETSRLMGILYGFYRDLTLFNHQKILAWT